MTPTRTPDRFEERLLAELRQIVAERPAPAPDHRARRARPARLAAAGGGVAVASAAVAAVVVSGGTAPAAYAVDARPDGRVVVHVRSLRDAAGLQRELRAAGVPAVVDYATTAPDGCAAPRTGAATSGGGATSAGPRAGSTSGRSAGARGARAGDRRDGPRLEVGVERGDGPRLERHGDGPGTAERGGPGRPAPTKTRVDGDGATLTIDASAVPAGQRVWITTSSGRVQSLSIAVGSRRPAPPCSPPEAG